MSSCSWRSRATRSTDVDRHMQCVHRVEGSCQVDVACHTRPHQCICWGEEAALKPHCWQRRWIGGMCTCRSNVPSCCTCRQISSALYCTLVPGAIVTGRAPALASQQRCQQGSQAGSFHVSCDGPCCTWAMLLPVQLLRACALSLYMLLMLFAICATSVCGLPLHPVVLLPWWPLPLPQQGGFKRH